MKIGLFFQKRLTNTLSTVVNEHFKLRTALFCATMISFGLHGISSLHAIEVRELTTPKGIKVWFAPDKSVPLIAVSFSFGNAGSTQNPKGLEGLSFLTASLLDEGAGQYDANQFKERLGAIGMRLGFTDSNDRFSGFFMTTLRMKKESVALFQDVLYRPRFDPARLDLLKTRLRPHIAESQKQPGYVLGRLYDATLFPDHPYGLEAGPTLTSLEAITINHVKTFFKSKLARNNLVVAVCGDAGSAEVMHLVDTLFGDLPETAKTNPTPKTDPILSGDIFVAEKKIPQTKGIISLAGLPYQHKDYWKLRLASSIFGQGFKGRLLQSLREKQGLVYTIDMYMNNLEQTSFITTVFGTNNDQVQKTLDGFKTEMDLFSEKGVTAKELSDAKQAAIGSYILGLSSTIAIANTLKGLQEIGYPLTYLNNRAQIINSIRLSDMNTFIKTFFKSQTPTTFLVGEPVLTANYINKTNEFSNQNKLATLMPLKSDNPNPKNDDTPQTPSSATKSADKKEAPDQ